MSLFRSLQYTTDWLAQHRDALPDGWSLELSNTGEATLTWYGGSVALAVAIAKLVGEAGRFDTHDGTTWFVWPAEEALGDRRPTLVVYIYLEAENG